MNLVGKRVFLCYTGQELPAILPINRGQPVDDGWFTLVGKVTGETLHGVWLRLERIWLGETENKYPEPDEYFIPWSAFKRAIMAKDQDEPPADLTPAAWPVPTSSRAPEDAHAGRAPASANGWYP